MLTPVRLPTLALLVLAPMAGSAWAQGDAAKGKDIALRWCSSCHAVSEEQAGASSDAPSFASIAARPPSDIDALAGFLAAPHPPMPNMSLTRDEIRNLLAYIRSLHR